MVHCRWTVILAIAEQHLLHTSWVQQHQLSYEAKNSKQKLGTSHLFSDAKKKRFWISHSVWSYSVFWEAEILHFYFLFYQIKKRPHHTLTGRFLDESSLTKRAAVANISSPIMAWSGCI